MPHPFRCFRENVPAHIVSRGHSRSPTFHENADYSYFLSQLSQDVSKHLVRIHAWVLMTNHFHLLATPESSDAIPRMMQSLKSSYSKYFNEKYGKSGSVWEGRYKSAEVSNSNYVVSCYRYIELNPVRAGIVKSPSEYLWSSYHANALGARCHITTPHSTYLNLATEKDSRLSVYRGLFGSELDPKTLGSFRVSGRPPKCQTRV